MANEPTPIDDNEILYRRIPVSKQWYNGKTVYAEAFEPRPDEHSGISLFRARFRSLEEAAKGMAKQGYYVAVLSVADLKRVGIIVEPRPETPNGWDDAHVELPGLTAKDRQTDEAETLQAQLAEIAAKRKVEGPFVSGNKLDSKPLLPIDGEEHESTGTDYSR